MQFEYDLIKSRTNKRKHGIDFDEVQALWNDPNRLEIPARETNEVRYLVVGLINATHWSVVITYRNQNVRLISARRSRREEVILYESI